MKLSSASSNKKKGETKRKKTHKHTYTTEYGSYQANMLFVTLWYVKQP